jgi:hypothetical protein
MGGLLLHRTANPGSPVSLLGLKILAHFIFDMAVSWAHGAKQMRSPTFNRSASLSSSPTPDIFWSNEIHDKPPTLSRIFISKLFPVRGAVFLFIFIATSRKCSQF